MKKLKIALIAFGILIMGLGVFILIGMYGMEIEDTYGDNQDIFYNSRNGDMAINHDSRELGRIAKSWTKFYIIHNADTLNISGWWDDRHIEIYRVTDAVVSLDNLRYEDIDRLIEEGELELIKKLR